MTRSSPPRRRRHSASKERNGVRRAVSPAGGEESTTAPAEPGRSDGQREGPLADGSPDGRCAGVTPGAAPTTQLHGSPVSGLSIKGPSGRSTGQLAAARRALIPRLGWPDRPRPLMPLHGLRSRSSPPLAWLARPRLPPASPRPRSQRPSMRVAVGRDPSEKALIEARPVRSVQVLACTNCET